MTTKKDAMCSSIQTFISPLNLGNIFLEPHGKAFCAPRFKGPIMTP